MNERLLKSVSIKLERHKTHLIWVLCLCLLAGVVGTSTYRSLIVEAEAWSKDPVCGLEEHVHDVNCYSLGERPLVCGLEESEGHMHNESCYDEEGNLICGQEEREGHVHGDECYGEAEPVLICERPEHVHEDACYPAEEAQPEEVVPEETKEGEEIVSGEPEVSKEPEASEDNKENSGAKEGAEAKEENAELSEAKEEKAEPEENEIIKDGTKEDDETLVFEQKSNGVVVRVSFENDKAFEESDMPVTMKVEPIREDDHKFSEIHDQIIDETEIPRARKMFLFDITFINKDGKELEPLTTASVSFTTDEIPVPEKEAVEKAEEQINVVHITNDGETKVMNVDVKTTEDLHDEEKPDVAFETDSFSIYGVVYTIDFGYELDGKETSFTALGGSEIRVEDMLDQLGISSEEHSAAEITGNITGIDCDVDGLIDVDAEERTITLAKEEEIKAVMEGRDSATLTVTLADDEVFRVILTLTGTPEVQAGDIATISSADGTYLPNDAEGSASILTEEQSSEAIQKVEETVTTDSAALSAEEEKPAVQYQVFDISLGNVNTEEYKNGFKVNVNLPEGIQGKDFCLYHIHNDQVTDITDSLVTSNQPVDENGLAVVSGFEFVTDGFSEFVLSYTVDFEYNGIRWSMPGRGSYRVAEILEKAEVIDVVKNVELAVLNVIGETDEKALYLEQKEDEWYLTSEVAFDDTYKLIVTGEKETYEFIVTDTNPTDSLDVQVAIYDYDGTTPLTNIPTIDDNYYLIAVVGSLDTESIKSNETPYWAIKKLDNFNGGNTSSPQVISIPGFSKDNNNPYGNSNNQKTYGQLTDEEKGQLTVRLVHTNENLDRYESLRNLAFQHTDQYEEMINGGFDGYDFMSSTGPVSGKDWDYEVNLQKGNKDEFDIKLVFDTPGAISAAHNYYVLLDATSQDGSKHYYKAVKIVSDGSSPVVYLPVNGNWSDGQKYSKNWQTITAKIVKPYNNSDLDNPNNCKNEQDKHYVYAYQLDGYGFTDISGTGGLVQEIDNENHLNRIEYVFNLNKEDLEEATSPDAILGEAVEFGIVAGKYQQNGHTETNFAVKEYQGSGANIDIDGSGDGAIPFYVGDVIDQLWISEKTKAPVDIFITSEDDDSNSGKQLDQRTLRLTTVNGVVIVHMTKDKINEYVEKLIRQGKNTSTAMAGKATVRPKKVSDIKIVDFTDFPDNTTIYVDCTDIVDSIIKVDGWEIYKKANQSIVFNVPGNEVEIHDFNVTVFDDAGNITVDKLHSTTQALDGDQVLNRTVDDVILNHITFNCYEAEKLHTNNASALFLAPFADRVTQNNGAGWILAEGTVDSGTEWHFYYHYRRYVSVSEGNVIRLEKKLTDKDGKIVPYINMDFKFKLTQTDSNWAPLNGGENMESTTTDDGYFQFRGFKYTNDDLSDGSGDGQNASKSFYYVIKEVPAQGAQTITGDDTTYYIDGVEYNKKIIKIRVDAVDDGEGKINCTFYAIDDNGVSTQIDPEINIFKFGTIENKVAVGKASIGGKKSITRSNGGSYTLTDEDVNAYTFKLTPITQNAPMPTVTEKKMNSKDDPTFNFGEIDFSAGHLNRDANGIPQTTVFEYQIEETGTRIGDTFVILNDERKHTVKITVSVDSNDHLKLNTDVKYYIDNVEVNSDDWKFNNIYTLCTEATLSGNKTLTGRDMVEGEFHFTAALTKIVRGNEEITDKQLMDGASPLNAIGMNTAANEGVSGQINFEKIKYFKPGKYYYTITEDTNSLENGVTQTGTTEFTAIVEVTESNEMLTAAVTYLEPVAFTNTWDGEKTSVTIDKKWFRGTEEDTSKTGSITFDLYRTTENISGTGSGDSSGDMISIEIRGGDGTVQPSTRIINAAEGSTITVTVKGRQNQQGKYDFNGDICKNDWGEFLKYSSYGSEQSFLEKELKVTRDLTHVTIHEYGIVSDYVFEAEGGGESVITHSDLVSIEPKEKVGTYSISSENSWTTTVDKLEKYADSEKTTEWNYFAIENVPSGYVDTYNTTETGWEISNTTNDQAGALKLTKEVTINGTAAKDFSEKTLADGDYTFTISGEGISNQVAVITILNGQAASAKLNDQAVELVDGFVVIPNLNPGTYTITETEPTNGSAISKINGTSTNEYSTTVTVAAGDTAAANASVTFTNNLNVVDLKIFKVDANDNHPLEGAMFTLLKSSTKDGPYTKVTYISGVVLNKDSWFTVPEDGIILSGLGPGFYQIREEKSPEGYIVTEKTPIAFEIKLDGKVENSSIAAVTYDSTDKSFTVPNTSGAELPHTGGPGTTIFTTLGMILIATAGILLLRRKRKGVMGL